MPESPPPKPSGLTRLSARLPLLAGEILLFVCLMLALDAFLTRDTASGRAPLADIASTGDPPRVVWFWAIWCPVCKAELAAMAELSGEIPLRAVAMQSGSEKEVAAYLRQAGKILPTANDPDGRIAARWGVTVVPTTFVLDRHGNIRFATRGFTTSIGLRVRVFLAGLMDGASGTTTNAGG